MRQPCCDCAGTQCLDCLTGATIDESAGCCHSHHEALIFRIERPELVTYAHGYGDNPFAPPPGCPGGCEYACTTTYEAAPAIQVVYRYERSYWRMDLAAIDSDRPPRCDLDCYPALTDCCGPPPFFSGCVCDPAAVLSPYQKLIMATTPQYKWLLDAACHNGGACFPPVRSLATCAEIPGAATLYNHLLGVVHLEHWWIKSECRAAIDPPLTINGADVQFDCIGPRRWIYACSGAPLYLFDLLDAAEREIITGAELCLALADIGEGRTPEQETLRKLWDYGYIRPRDWRAEALVELAELKARFPTAYAGCTLPETCADLGYLGPVRKRWAPCLKASEVADHAAGLQIPAACRADPWDGGPYPTEGDPDYEDFLYWKDRQWVYFHARPGGWDWICFDPAVPDTEAPDLPRRFSASCPGNGCLNVSGYPRDFSSVSGPFTGVNPSSGLATCPVDCGDDAGNPYGCIFTGLACGAALDGSTCVNVGIGASCDGLHFVNTEVLIDQVEPSTCYPSGVRFYCGHVNHAYLFGLNRRCGDWDAEACLACRSLAVPIEVANLVPVVYQTNRAILGLCNQIRNGCAADPLCCSLVCVSFEPCGGFDVIGPACPSTPTFENRESQAKCYP